MIQLNLILLNLTLLNHILLKVTPLYPILLILIIIKFDFIESDSVESNKVLKCHKKKKQKVIQPCSPLQLSEYELQRLRNITANNKVLHEIIVNHNKSKSDTGDKNHLKVDQFFLQKEVQYVSLFFTSLVN